MCIRVYMYICIYVYMYMCLYAPEKRARGRSLFRDSTGRGGVAAARAAAARSKLRRFREYQRLNNKNKAKGWPLLNTVLLVVLRARINLFNRPLILPARLHCLHCNSTIARLLGNIRLPPNTPFVCHTSNNIGNNNI